MELNESKHLDPSKVELLCLANDLYQLNSLCDIGGVWGVGGGYSIYAKSVLGIPDVTLIDSHWTEESRVLCHHSGVEIEENFFNLSKNNVFPLYNFKPFVASHWLNKSHGYKKAIQTEYTGLFLSLSPPRREFLY